MGCHRKTPPVAEADFIPIEVEDDKGLFRVLATATDPDGDSLDITAVIEACGESIPVENGQLVEIKIEDDCKIDTRLNISISKSIREYLKKTENMSEYIESLIFFDQFVSGRAPGHIMFFGDGSACAGLPWKNIKYRKVPRWQIVGFLVVSSEMTNKSTSQN